MQLVVATIGAPHGLKGEVKLNIRSDEPELRLADGNRLETDPADAGPLTVVRTRIAPNGFFALFEEARDRAQAEALRGVDLVIETDEEDAEADAWYPHELIGMRALHKNGQALGEVTGVETNPAHDLLSVREPNGAQTLVPFVSAIVLDVDEEAGCVILDPPGGLFASDPVRPVVVEETRNGADGTEGDADGAGQAGGENA